MPSTTHSGLRRWPSVPLHPFTTSSPVMRRKSDPCQVSEARVSSRLMLVLTNLNQITFTLKWSDNVTRPIAFEVLNQRSVASASTQSLTWPVHFRPSSDAFPGPDLAAQCGEGDCGAVSDGTACPADD